MVQVKVKITRAGARRAMHLPGVRAMLQARADRIAANAASQLHSHDDEAYGPPFTAGVDDRAVSLIGYVVTSNIDGMRAEARDRVLTRALGS